MDAENRVPTPPNKRPERTAEKRGRSAANRWADAPAADDCNH